MRSHPYRLIGKRLERSLRQALKPVITGWVTDWLPDETSFAFQTLMPLFEYCQEKESTEIHQIISWVDDNWCGVLKPVELGHLGSLLLDTTDESMDEIASSVLLRDVAQQALIELAQRILSGTQAAYDNVPFFLADNLIPKGAEWRGSGAVVIKFSVGSLSFDYVVSPITVERYLKGLDTPHQESRQKLIPLQAALGNQKLNARVSLGSAALSLGELATICIGDVVTLDKRIDEPASMRLGVNGDACEGSIGTKGESLAFRISRIET